MTGCTLKNPILSIIARLIAAVTVVTLVVRGGTSTVTSVSIDGGDRSIVLGEALTLAATVVVTGTASQAVTWSSSDEAVATIAAGGQVTGLTTGTTDITATSTTDATKSDTINLTIDPPDALRWARQFGTSSDDIARGIATDANGNVYAAGDTLGDLEGSNAGVRDAFIRSYGP